MKINCSCFHRTSCRKKESLLVIITVLDTSTSYYAYCGGQENERRLGGRVLNITLLMTQLETENWGVWFSVERRCCSRQPPEDDKQFSSLSQSAVWRRTHWRQTLQTCSLQQGRSLFRYFVNFDKQVCPCFYFFWNFSYTFKIVGLWPMSTNQDHPAM